MLRGRPPQSKKLNDLKGDLGRHRRKEVEPEPPKGIPELPDHLDDIATEE